MPTLAIFIIVLSIAGGFIAWLGDRLGTYIGKKRLSKFGLRPRHTAMLYTIASGVLIAAITLVVLMLYDNRVYFALQHGRQMQLDNKNLTADNRKLMIGIREKQQENARLLADMPLLQQQKATIAAELGSKKSELAKVSNELTATRGALNNTQVALQLKNENLKLAQGEYQAEALKVAAQRRQLDADTIAMIKREKKLAQMEPSKGVPIVLRRMQELGRREFATNETPDHLTRQLQNFMATLSSLAVEKGLSVGSNGRAVAVTRVDAKGLLFAAKANKVKPLKIVGHNAVSVRFGEDMELKALAGSIASSPPGVKSIAIVAVSNGNWHAGDQAKIDLYPFINKLVFQRGHVIATAVVDGSQSIDDVLASVQSFLIHDVRPVALKSGIIPGYDPETDEPSVGEPIDKAKWEDLIKQIRRIGGEATITASASEDTYSKDKLRLTFTATAAPQHNQRTTSHSQIIIPKDGRNSSGRAGRV